jgi:hypothetical protein
MDRNVCRTSSDVSIRRYYCFCCLRDRKKKERKVGFFFSFLVYLDWLLYKLEYGLVYTNKNINLYVAERDEEQKKEKFNIVNKVYFRNYFKIFAFIINQAARGRKISTKKKKEKFVDRMADDDA